jgi:glycine hydroxymethyltransferase
MLKNIAIDRAKNYLCSKRWAAQAHKQILRFTACIKPGDKILGFDLSIGVSHGSPVFSGRLYTFWYGDPATGLDYDKIQSTTREQPN